jgi:hypothetical protein
VPFSTLARSSDAAGGAVGEGAGTAVCGTVGAAEGDVISVSTGLDSSFCSGEDPALTGTGVGTGVETCGGGFAAAGA